MMSVLDSISPLFTGLTRTSVSKKTLEDAKKIINKQTLLLELGGYIDDIDNLDLTQI